MVIWRRAGLISTIAQPMVLLPRFRRSIFLRSHRVSVYRGARGWELLPFNIGRIVMELFKEVDDIEPAPRVDILCTSPDLMIDGQPVDLHIRVPWGELVYAHDHLGTIIFPTGERGQVLFGRIPDGFVGYWRGPTDSRRARRLALRSNN